MLQISPKVVNHAAANNQIKTIDMKNGNTGASAIWDGPLGAEGRPTAKGNARNKMEVRKYPLDASEAGKPITQCAKGKY